MRRAIKYFPKRFLFVRQGSDKFHIGFFHKKAPSGNFVGFDLGHARFAFFYSLYV